MTQATQHAGQSDAATGLRQGARDYALPRSDWFTVFLHWASAIAMFLSLFTGMRIAADALDAVVPKWFEPILLQGDMWTVHFISALSFFFTATAYVVYLRAGELFNRNSLSRLRILGLKAPMKLKWGSLNVLLHWLNYALLLTLMATGIAMYLGHGGWIIAVHRAVAITSIAYIFAHVIVHFMYGGWLQLLRIFLPQSLKVRGFATSKPAWLSLAVAVPLTGALAAVDWGTRDTLVAQALKTPLDMTKLLADPAWATARPVFVHTSQGENFGGTGESLIEMRALHDAEKIYFAFRWEDPTRSVARLPLIKKADGWHMLGTWADRMDVNDLYEDKFTVLFTHSDAFGSGGVAHFGPSPVPGKPMPMNARGLHYTTDGSTHEMWNWKSTRGGVLGSVDHQYIGPAREPTQREVEGKDRYQGGYWNYDGSAPYTYNYVSEPVGGYGGAIGVKFLPKDLAATQRAMNGPITRGEDHVREDQRYWMNEEETVPYSKEVDAQIPVGTIIPGVVLKNGGMYTGPRGALTANAKWADAHWTLLVSRALKPADPKDEDFSPGASVNMYVVAYDHSQTRHTRHQRPVRLKVE